MIQKSRPHHVANQIFHQDGPEKLQDNEAERGPKETV